MSARGWYLYGNHFHWVDMQWLWGYGVLGSSLRDMLAFTRATGAPGNLNFDGVGYERIAAEDPEALALLKEAVAAGEIEIVGASYAQPYGLFHHGESAVRQLVYGARAVERLAGTRPLSFWEEEFYFFPQLPQLLVDLGYEYASLFFQWTWHTPHVPVEEDPAIWWVGVDGTRILTLPRGPLNLHQWPEDFESLLEAPLLTTSAAPVVQQWLELLPSPDWMCRSELVADGVRQLVQRSDVDFQMGTMATVLEAVREHAVERTYTMDDVFHGMSLGKNGDHGHRRSRRLEHQLLAAEAFAVLASTGGRPYPHWDAYPGWELEECWRELLTFQHHDNDECEGLCGHVGYAGLDRAEAIVEQVIARTVKMIAARTPGAPGQAVALNPLGWRRDVVLNGRRWSIPPLGVRVLDVTSDAVVDPVLVHRADGRVLLRRGDFEIVVDEARGVVTGVGDLSCGPAGLGNLRWVSSGEPWDFPPESVQVIGSTVVVERRGPAGQPVEVVFSMAPEADALDICFVGDLGAGPDGGAHAALMTLVEPDLEVTEVRADTPYALGPITGRGTYTRKYPTGEWMTSPQWYEEVRDPFTSLQLVDFLDDSGGGLLWLHDGSQAFHRASAGAWNVLSMRDPWDEGYYIGRLAANARVIAHHGMSDTQRWQRAQEFTRPVLVEPVPGAGYAQETHVLSSMLSVSGQGVVLTACYRDSELAHRSRPGHVDVAAGTPTVLIRLVEFDGSPSTATITAPGLRRAWRTTGAGELLEELLVVDGRVVMSMRQREIATVALDVDEARPVPRNLDDHRDVWATAHRGPEESSTTHPHK